MKFSENFQLQFFNGMLTYNASTGGACNTNTVVELNPNCDFVVQVNAEH